MPAHSKIVTGCNPKEADIAQNKGDFTSSHVFSSEGALYVILPYDYPARSGTHFLNTHRSLTTTLSIDALMTLLTVISMKTKITEIT